MNMRSSIPNAGKRILAGLDEAAEIEKLRQRFVHDFQYRYHQFSDHYSIVAMFAREVASEAVAQAMSAGTAKTAQPVEGDSPPARSEGCAKDTPASPPDTDRGG